jgi:hypothetical protein
MENTMPKSDWRRVKHAGWPAVALVLAVPIGLLAQGGQGQRGDGAGGAAPAGGAAVQAPGQGRGGGQRPGGPGGAAGGAGARAAAPVDLTGYWVSIVTEDWIERMSPDSPASGVPRGGGPGGGGGGGGRRGGGGGGGGAVSPPPEGERCRAYAAGGSLRVPGRLNITWADDNTLKIDMDSGTQTRLLHFTSNQPAPAQRTLQGYSVATWETGRGGGGGFGGGGGGGGGRPGGAPAAPRWGSLRVVTTSMTGGYLLSSRNTYSENATLTEHFTRHADFGVEYFTVTAVISDGGNDRITSSTFKKEPNGSKFSPTGCEVVR